MTNIQAAIGLAQLERIEELIKRHRYNARLYSELLKGSPSLVLPVERKWANHVYWVYGILLKNFYQSRNQVMEYLAKREIETRPFFYPVHLMPPYHRKTSLPVAEMVSAQGIILPSSANLLKDNIHQVCQELMNLLQGRSNLAQSKE